MLVPHRPLVAAVAGAALIAAVLAANYLTSTYGLVWAGPGLVTTAGTYTAGVVFVLRDTIHDALRPPARAAAIAAVIATGAGLSFLVADPAIAVASAVAFGCAELADYGVYAPLRRHGYVRAAIASNVVGALLDTFLFLWIAGFPVMAAAVAGQMTAKLAVTALAVLAVLGARAR